MNNGISNNAKGILLMLLTQLIWSFSILFTKMLTNGYTWSEIISWRFVISLLGFFILIFMGIFKVNFRGKSLKPLFLMTLCHPILYFIGETYGIAKTTASESSIFIAMIPVVTLLFAILILSRKPGLIQVLGIVLSVIGIVVMIGIRGEASFNIRGYLMLGLAVFASAIYFTLSDNFQQYTATEKSFTVSFAGAIFFTVYSLLEKIVHHESIMSWFVLPIADPGFLAGTAYLGIGCSLIAYCSINAAIRYIGVERSTSFANITTVITVIGGVFMLHEKLTPWQFAGIFLVLVGVYLANKSPKHDI
ncbi:MAG: DMT family transporter [Eubacteriales bacterium]